jgi:CHAT domain-containing protein/tetratricopeptide (TPR) repeat protein
MRKLESLIYQLNQLEDRQDRQGAVQAAQELWKYSSYEEEITKDPLRGLYIRALFVVADLSSSETAIAALTRAYSLDDGHFDAAKESSAKEAAAYNLGMLYEKLGSYHSAVWWFRRALSLARTAGVRENILVNLGGVGRNLEYLSVYEEARQYYDEILAMVSNISSLVSYLQYLVPAAMYHIYHGVRARGEEIMRRVVSVDLREYLSTDKEEPTWFYFALHYLGMHYVTTGRPQEAIQLAQRIKSSDQPDTVRDAFHHGLMAKAFIQMGQLGRALKELAQVHDVNRPSFDTNPGNTVEILELWIDIARIHVAQGHYELAMDSYVMLAYQLGTLISNTRWAWNVRLRFYWLQQMAFVVHEMVSVWMSIPDMRVRQEYEATVGNALLQLKGNLFIAIGYHRGPFMSLKYELFIANRKYAIAARKVISKPDESEVLLELEEALREREKVEGFLSTGEINPSLTQAVIFRRDFRESYILTKDSLVLDYSLINYQPPQNGLAGPSLGLRYIGVRLAPKSLHVVDLGEVDQIKTLCQPLIQALSTQPTAGGDASVSSPNQRHLRPADRNQPKVKTDVDELSKRVYERIVAPFEPLSRSLLFSPDGILAAIPFHGLLHENRYLVEDRDVAYCYSLLQRESLYMRQISTTTAVRPPSTSSALLVGDPNYTASNLTSLVGTKIEVSEIAQLLKARNAKQGMFDEVRVHTGSDAIASQLLAVYQPLILHIAAHGTFDENQSGLFIAKPLKFGGYYRRWQQMIASPLNELDNTLLHSKVMLAEDSEAIGDPARGAELTALELASLNLAHGLVVLSACETAAGVTEPGAGVLGFQYALMAACAQSGLLSLWKVLDQETSAFMIDFYRNFQDQQRAKAGYLAAVRKHCRQNGQRVHPYYWAAFIFLDQEYWSIR